MNRNGSLVSRLLAYNATEQGSTLGLTSDFFVTLGKVFKSSPCQGSSSVKKR